MTNVNALVSMPFGAVQQMLVAASGQAQASAVGGSPLKPSAPLKRAMLVNDVLSRTTVNAVGTLRLVGTHMDAETIGEIFAMQSAVMKQVWQLGQDWRDGLQQLAQEGLSLREANTLSKVMEQDFNLVGQAGELISNQMTNVMALMESISVGYAYWLSKKLDVPASS